jgi:hypothetical protein
VRSVPFAALARAETLQDGASALLELAKKVAYILCMLITGCYKLPLTQRLVCAIFDALATAETLQDGASALLAAFLAVVSCQ